MQAISSSNSALILLSTFFILVIRFNLPKSLKGFALTKCWLGLNCTKCLFSVIVFLISSLKICFLSVQKSDNSIESEISLILFIGIFLAFMTISCMDLSVCFLAFSLITFLYLFWVRVSLTSKILLFKTAVSLRSSYLQVSLCSWNIFSSGNWSSYILFSSIQARCVTHELKNLISLCISCSFSRLRNSLGSISMILTLLFIIVLILSYICWSDSHLFARSFCSNMKLMMTKLKLIRILVDITAIIAQPIIYLNASSMLGFKMWKVI